jgi:hypothetical protein
MEECCICFEESVYLFTTRCKHKFHHNCLFYWCKTSDTCPCCREKNPTGLSKIKEKKKDIINNYIFITDSYIRPQQYIIYEINNNNINNNINNNVINIDNNNNITNN